MAGLTLDTGALIAYERGQERMREILAVAFGRGLVPTVPAIALAEAWTGGPQDARIARLLKACSVEPLSEQLARAGGKLRRQTPGASTVDACIACGVRQRGDAVVTSDPGDMRDLLGSRFTILRV
ncbi:MAG TPA: PIN domain-containing protein [Conexibacter sp.]|nr:PIN domain-containing protein [Conexibacter sp.]